MSDKTINKNERTAKALIALGCVKQSGDGYEVRMPVMRHQHPIIFQVAVGADGKMICDCFGFMDKGFCPHTAAADILAAPVKEFHYQAGEIELHYENDSWAEAA